MSYTIIYVVTCNSCEVECEWSGATKDEAQAAARKAGFTRQLGPDRHMVDLCAKCAVSR